MIRFFTYPVSLAHFFNALCVGLALFLFTSPTAQAQQIVTVAGGYGGEGASLNQISPQEVLFDDAGFMYVGDRFKSRILKYPPNSTSVTTGTVVAGDNGDGSAANQLGQGFYQLAFDKSGYLYVLDGDNSRVQKFPPNSTSATSGTTVAGGNGRGSGANQFSSPLGLAVDGAGFIYVSEFSNARVKKFPPTSTSATSGTTVFARDPNNFTVNDVFIDKADNLYVTTQEFGVEGTSAVIKFPPNSTTATTGTVVAQNDPRTYGYQRITVDGGGNIYIANWNFSFVWMQPSTSSSAASRILIAEGGSSANGVLNPFSLCLDAAGYLYIADWRNYRVQRYSPTVAVIVNQPVGNFCANPGTTVTATVKAEAFPTLAYQWYKNNLSSPVSGQTSPTLSLTNVQVSDIGSYSVVISANGRSITSTVFNLNVINLVGTQPTSLTQTEGQTARFLVTPALTGSTLQWQTNPGSGFTNLTNNSSFSGVNSTTLSIANLSPFQNGNLFRVVVNNGICSTTSVVSTLTVNPAPDLTPILSTLPSTHYGTTNFTAVLDVFELNSGPAAGPVLVYITKDPSVVLSFNGASTVVGGKPVQNGNWSFDGTSNNNFYILTCVGGVSAGGKQSVGLSGVSTPGGTQGRLTLSAMVSVSNGAELQLTNNSDADQIEYFRK